MHSEFEKKNVYVNFSVNQRFMTQNLKRRSVKRKINLIGTLHWKPPKLLMGLKPPYKNYNLLFVQIRSENFRFVLSSIFPCLHETYITNYVD